MRHKEISFENWMKSQKIKDAEDIASHYDVGDNDLVNTYHHKLNEYELEDIVERMEDDDEIEDKISSVEDLDPFYHSEYKKLLLEELEKDYRSRFSEFESKYRSFKDPVILYRAVCLGDINKLNKKQIGVFWTDDIDSADCYHDFNKQGKDYFVLKAEIPIDGLDWEQTIHMNLSAYGESEQEITVKKNQNIKIIDVRDKKDWLGIAFEANTGTGEWQTKALLVAALKKLI